LGKFRIVSILLTFAMVFSFFGLPKSTFAATPVYNKQIEINKATNWLYLYENGTVVKPYRVATGRTKELTPEGTFPIVVKIVSPGWKGVPGGDPKNPLGPRWNGISVNGDNGRTYGIHGTNDPSSIGNNASSGCVRMLNDQVIDLYSRVYEGVPVWIHTDASDTGNTKDRKWRGDSTVGLKYASGTVTTTTNTNAWTGPSTGSFKITSVAKSTVLTRTGVSGTWTQVKLPNDRIGFIYNGDLNTGLTFYTAHGFAKITVDDANIRTAPNLSSSVIEKAKMGTNYTLLADNGEWYRITTSSGKTAYVSHLVAKKWTVTVTVDVANVRSAPSLTASVVKKVYKGTVLTKLGMVGDFHKIRLDNGSIAYIHKTVAN
jgi:uncharacterized protein YgiM (DUF1202 family)